MQSLAGAAATNGVPVDREGLRQVDKRNRWRNGWRRFRVGEPYRDLGSGRRVPESSATNPGGRM